MNRITKYRRHVKITYLKMAGLVILISFFLLPNFTKVEKTGNNVFDVVLNGEVVGCVSSKKKAENLMWKARRKMAAQADGMFLANSDLSVNGREAYFVRFTEDKTVVENMCNALKKEQVTDRKMAYSLKINQLVVNLSGIDDVRYVLQKAVDVFQDQERFKVEIGADLSREVNVLTAQTIDAEEEKKEKIQEKSTALYAGITKELFSEPTDARTDDQKSFDDFAYGIKDISFGDRIEIVQACLTPEEIMTKEEAAELVMQQQQKEETYEVQKGDTLSEISLNCDVPLDSIIALNDFIENENSTIRIGDKLLITQPKPQLAVNWEEELYYEEDYEADIQYVDNDSWYTTESVVLQQPSGGHRKVAALKKYVNEKELDTEILKEEVTVEAIPKIVERGTRIPPTYIKPISGGRLSSGFGRRKAPKRGASTYHKGVDWATPVGTPVSASCGGTVTRAGWSSGYGYLVCISHEDGRETRYGHLSKILVKSGQKVSQGQVIAKSGNTGRSTGPHLHFEIRIGGEAVNPLSYIN